MCVIIQNNNKTNFFKEVDDVDIKDINPFIRFASLYQYKSKGRYVYGRDNRLFYIVSGEGEILIGSQKFKLTPDSLLYCAQDIVYNIRARNGISYVVLNFDLAQNCNHFTLPFAPVQTTKEKFMMTEPPESNEDNFLDSYYFWENGKGFYNEITNIVSEHSMHHLYYAEKCSAMLKNLLVDMHREILYAQTSTSGAISKVISHINRNYTNPITNSELAGLTKYHEYHLNRVFIKHTGTTMHQYILNKRINKAVQLILTTDLSMGEIAEQSGFNNQTYFSKCFKVQQQMSPTEFKKCFKNKI